uniref:Ovule protein n=1 Tax=Rodentolepis nana TaxID=102285 RepID=A0A0R3TGA1_RODNA
LDIRFLSISAPIVSSLFQGVRLVRLLEVQKHRAVSILIRSQFICEIHLSSFIWFSYMV